MGSDQGRLHVRPSTEPKKFPKQIAFNVIPYIGEFKDDGYTDEEQKMWNETHKMLDPDIKLTVTCVRVPVMVGHSEAVNIEFENPLDEDEARDILRNAPGIAVIDKRDETGYITPKESQGEFEVFVSRIRNDPTVEHGLEHLGGLGQPPQRRGPERGADRRAAARAGVVAADRYRLIIFPPPVEGGGGGVGVHRWRMSRDARHILNPCHSHPRPFPPQGGRETSTVKSGWRAWRNAL